MDRVAGGRRGARIGAEREPVAGPRESRRPVGSRCYNSATESP